MRKVIGALFALGLIGGVALADDPDAGGKKNAPAPKGGNAGGNGKVKVYDFSGDTIEGDLVKPEGSTVDARDFAKHGSLIRIRKDFIPEIIKSAEDLP